MSGNGFNLRELLSPTRGDWDGAMFLFFAQYGIPIVCAGPLLATGFPASIIMLYLLPAFVWQQVACEIYYAWMGIRLAKNKGSNDVTGLPGTGVDLVGSIAITFGVVMPTWLSTNDAMLAWGMGVACNILYGIIKIAIFPFAEWIRKLLPRAALLGFIGGILLVYIGTVYGVTIFTQPYVGFFAMVFVLVAMYGQLKTPIPPLAIIMFVGAIIGFFAKYTTGFGSGFPGFYFFRFTPIGFGYLGKAFMKYAPLIVPLTVGYQLMWTLSNLEAADAVGDKYSAREVLLADSLLTTIGGALFGSWMPTFVLTGHPGWKAAGARISYLLIAAVIYLVTGISGLLWAGMNVIPVGAIAGIFVWLALTLAQVAVDESPKKHIPAVFITFIPAGAYLLQTQISPILKALEVDMSTAVPALLSAGIALDAINMLAWGFPLTCIVWGAMLVNIIECNSKLAACWCLLGAVLSVFGLMHAETIGLMAAPMAVVLGYIIMAVVLYFSGFSLNKTACPKD